MALPVALFKFLYVKTVLLGVMPFKFHLFARKLKLRRELLVYGGVISVLMPTVRMLMHAGWVWNSLSNSSSNSSNSRIYRFSVMMVATMATECAEIVLLIIVPCYLLACHAKMSDLFEQLVRLFRSPLLDGCVRWRAWFYRCYGYNACYEGLFLAVLLIFLASPMRVVLLGFLALIPAILVTTFTKAAIMLVMFGTGQLLLLTLRVLNGRLEAGCCEPFSERLRRDWNGLMACYEGVWQSTVQFNDLFGVPILCYLLLVFVHTTTMLYIASTEALMDGQRELSTIDSIVTVVETGWAMFEVLYLMTVVGTCSQLQEELNGLGKYRPLFVHFFHCSGWLYQISEGPCESDPVEFTPSSHKHSFDISLVEMLSDQVINNLLIAVAVQATLFGLLTLKYDRQKRQLTVSKMLVVYGICVTVGVAITYQSTLFILTRARFRAGFKLTVLNVAITAVQGQVVMHIFISSAVRRYRKRFVIAKLLEDLGILQRELFNSTEIDMRWLKLRILRKISLSQAILTSGFVLGIVELLKTGENNLLDEVGLLSVFYYPKIGILCSVSLYYGVMMFLQNLHYALNERLKLIVREHFEGDGESDVKPLRGYARIHHSVYIRCKLNHLAQAQSQIVACCARTHAFYANMLLSCNFLCMTFIIYQMYHFFEIFYVHFRTNSSLSVVGLIHESLTCVFCFFEVYSIAEVCEAVRGQSRKTQALLFRLNIPKMDPQLKQSIEVFALQTLHQPIEFTACKMFTLDYTVLFSIIASVTSYLIILIQFELASEN